LKALIMILFHPKEHLISFGNLRIRPQTRAGFCVDYTGFLGHFLLK
jgi:hypothetical protein